MSKADRIRELQEKVNNLEAQLKRKDELLEEYRKSNRRTLRDGVIICRKPKTKRPPFPPDSKGPFCRLCGDPTNIKGMFYGDRTICSECRNKGRMKY